MRVSVLLQIIGDDGVATPAEEIADFDKATNRAEDLGLSIAEGKAVLAALQSRTVKAQAVAWSERHRSCAACNGKRYSKGSYPVVFHTLYGDVELDSPRLYRCPCQKAEGPATVSPLRDLIGNRVAPERLYLEARWASLVPYASAAGPYHPVNWSFDRMIHLRLSASGQSDGIKPDSRHEVRPYDDWLEPPGGAASRTV